MDEEPSVTITFSAFSKWLFLGLPAIIIWGISFSGAAALSAGLNDGSVITGTPRVLGAVWTIICFLALAGMAFGMSSLFRPTRTFYLVLNVLVAFVSLFFGAVPLT